MAKWVAVGEQLVGGATAAAGLYLLVGLAWTLLVVGLCVAGWGTAREAGWL